MISLNAAWLSRGFPGAVLSTRTLNQIVAGIALIVNLLIIELFSVYMGVQEILIIPTEGGFTLGLQIESHLWNILVTHRVRTWANTERNICKHLTSFWERKSILSLKTFCYKLPHITVRELFKVSLYLDTI